MEQNKARANKSQGKYRKGASLFLVFDKNRFAAATHQPEHLLHSLQRFETFIANEIMLFKFFAQARLQAPLDIINHQIITGLKFASHRKKTCRVRHAESALLSFTVLLSAKCALIVFQKFSYFTEGIGFQIAHLLFGSAKRLRNFFDFQPLIEMEPQDLSVPFIQRINGVFDFLQKIGLRHLFFNIAGFFRNEIERRHRFAPPAALAQKIRRLMSRDLQDKSLEARALPRFKTLLLRGYICRLHDLLRQIVDRGLIQVGKFFSQKITDTQRELADRSIRPIRVGAHSLTIRLEVLSTTVHFTCVA